MFVLNSLYGGKQIEKNSIVMYMLNVINYIFSHYISDNEITLKIKYLYVLEYRLNIFNR